MTPLREIPPSGATCKQKHDLMERITSATIGAVLTSLIISPLEVVKVRLQSQATSAVMRDVYAARTPIECMACEYIYFETGPFAEQRVSKHSLACKQHAGPFKGTMDAMRWIIRNEGPASLFNGIQATIWMSIPATVLYFASYEEIRDRLNLAYPEMKTFNPMFSGMIARCIGGTVVAPLELIRTKAQAEHHPPSIREMVRQTVSAHGVSGFWRGLSPTLWRDVPFSGIYWILVERLRLRMQVHSDNIAVVSAVSGALSGMVAALFTHPFDVVKTRRQVFAISATAFPQGANSTWGMLRHIVHNQGMQGLMVGVVPRVAKVAPSTAIMLTTYEVGKRFFHEAL